MAAAENVFAADTAAALAQITAAAQAAIPGQALAAASMACLAGAFAHDLHTGCQRLVRLLPQQTGAVDRALREQAVTLADPTGDYRAVRGLPGGAQVAAAWQARDHVLAAYHRTLGEQRDPATALRSLLRDHHMRALGIDPTFERTTNRLARAAAQRLLAVTPAHVP